MQKFPLNFKVKPQKIKQVLQTKFQKTLMKLFIELYFIFFFISYYFFLELQVS